MTTDHGASRLLWGSLTLVFVTLAMGWLGLTAGHPWLKALNLALGLVAVALAVLAYVRDRAAKQTAAAQAD